ncbi:hypothetical protein D3C81_1027680 [compost metagenome]
MVYRKAALIGMTIALNADAAFYTEEPDPSYQKASIALFCMNHFYNRTMGHLGMQAGMNAQEDLAKLIPSLADGQKLADELRLALNAITKGSSDKSVPVNCWQYIPTDHGLTSEEIQHFLKHSSLD